MRRSLIPLLILIVGLPQLSETVYTPALPDIAHSLAVSDAWVEYTLTIYLVGFAVGTLFWGRLSDRLGRKPCLILGLFIYTFGCIGCFFSSSILWLMISRFVQAFGGSTGSVVGQAICRDAYQGSERGKAYATIGSVIAFAPAVGPVLGGVIDQSFGWSCIFLFLIVIGSVTLITTYLRLPETHFPESRHAISLKSVALRLFSDSHVISYGILVSACNGILFSFYAEGSFYLIDLLGLSPSIYGLSFVGIAMAGVIGAWITRRMHDFKSPKEIIKLGISLIILGATLFMVMTFIFALFAELSTLWSIGLTLGSMMCLMIGVSMVVPNALSSALEGYKYGVGTASSLFGLFYYTIISLFTLGMGVLHNGTLFPMPIYFWIIGLLMWYVFSKWIVRERLDGKKETYK